MARVGMIAQRGEDGKFYGENSFARGAVKNTTKEEAILRRFAKMIAEDAREGIAEMKEKEKENG